MYLKKNKILNIFDLQKILFAAQPSRLALQSLRFDSAENQKLEINIWRNHACEPVVSMVIPYLHYAKFQGVFRIGSYDDSLGFFEYKKADVELIWFDVSRLSKKISNQALLNWLKQRLQALRQLSNAPIILATWADKQERVELFDQMVKTVSDTYFANLKTVCDKADIQLLDSRLSVIAGSSLSSAAQTIIARELGCHWLPAVALPQLKAIALDLDQTLHNGVLGEDGVNGVQITPGHKALQDHIKNLINRGVFVALVSRNERQDVEDLFNIRTDYPLRLGDFSVLEISWDDKALAMGRIAEQLRISTDSILFVDDNPGELINVASHHPLVQMVCADPDPYLTLRTIEYFPGFWRWKEQPEDKNRIADLIANSERQSIAAGQSKQSDYFKSLEVTAEFYINYEEHLPRIAELCKKTNQFNANLSRLSLSEIAKHMQSDDSTVVSVRLTDRLAESGVIAVIIAKRDGGNLIVEELCISCRALGRDLENLIIFSALGQMAGFNSCKDVCFRNRIGPRNQPAITWLNKVMQNNEGIEGDLQVVSKNKINEFVRPEGVEIKIKK